MIERDWREEFRDECFGLRQALQEHYDNSGEPVTPHQRNGYRNEAYGGQRFASTLALTMKRAEDPEAVRKVNSALEAIIDKPKAGETAWEMRRVIRRVPTFMIGEFGDLMKELAIHTKGELWISFDDFYWETVEGYYDLEVSTVSLYESLIRQINQLKSSPVDKK